MFIINAILLMFEQDAKQCAFHLCVLVAARVSGVRNGHLNLIQMGIKCLATTVSSSPGPN